MKKMRSNAGWNTFTPQQKEAIEEWLLVQNLSYKAVLKRCAEELGLKWSLTAICRTYKHLAAARAVRDTMAMDKTSEELIEKGKPAERLRPSIMKMAATRLLEKAIENSDTQDMARYGRLLMQGEAQQIQRDRAALAAKRHEFNASQAALKALPFVNDFTHADLIREKARTAAIRLILFGNAPKKGVAK
ncbi:MAG TPA: hypothetical protein VG754_11280 [Verrucomicrobiae bacterium]|nr:hypothetical protein [Verrucomicrobiae bacterium]